MSNFTAGFADAFSFFWNSGDLNYFGGVALAILVYTLIMLIVYYLIIWVWRLILK